MLFAISQSLITLLNSPPSKGGVDSASGEKQKTRWFLFDYLIYAGFNVEDRAERIEKRE